MPYRPRRLGLPGLREVAELIRRCMVLWLLLVVTRILCSLPRLHILIARHGRWERPLESWEHGIARLRE